jgi:glycogen debranching enzyme
MIPAPRFASSSPTAERAFSIALGDLGSNIVPSSEGLLDREAPVFRAGAGYEKTWTRDAAINVWNGAGLVYPAEARNTLLSVLDRKSGRVVIGGPYEQYWDAIIWTLGAWAFYLFTGDRDFLELAFEATRNSLRHYEETELTPELTLFRGPAVYGDGVAAYPDIYAQTAAADSMILHWPAAHPDLASRPGRGLPMHALSTNCVYFRAYQVASEMARELGLSPVPEWAAKAADLRQAINRHFWLPHAGSFRYLVDPFGGSDAQEGFGHSFVILFGIADAASRESVFENQHVTSAGIPCLWPCFSRYRRDGDYGRHSGTVWPPIQGFWAEAAARHRRLDLFAFEFETLARHAVRDGQFFEIYHPDTGLPYGGLQESGNGESIDSWESLPHQTWSATAYLRMVLFGLAGMRFDVDGVRFEPLLPRGLENVELHGLRYRGATIDLVLEGAGGDLAQVLVNGEEAAPFVPATASGRHVLELTLRG